jgi:type IV pilus assembly protein PilX
MKPVQHLQKGSALIVSLVLLLVLTVLSISAMRGTTMQERMAGNFRETNAAFQAAEAALRVGEQYLNLATVGPFKASTSACSAGDSGLYEERTGDNPERWEDTGCAWITVTTGNYEGQAPEYMIEQRRAYAEVSGSLAADAPLPESRYYRITARGYSASSGNTPVTILQSSYRRE